MKKAVADKVAQAVKDYIVELAEKDKLPMDLNELRTDKIATIVKKAVASGEKECVKDAILNRAGCYLSNDEGEIEDVIRLIAETAKKDPNENIDFLEKGDLKVIVWEKCEMAFTCKEFLSAIGYDEKLFN